MQKVLHLRGKVPRPSEEGSTMTHFPLNLARITPCHIIVAEGPECRGKPPVIPGKGDPMANSDAVSTERLSPETKAALGSMFVELFGQSLITDSTRRAICDLNPDDLPLPFSQFVAASRGSYQDNPGLSLELIKDLVYFSNKLWESARGSP